MQLFARTIGAYRKQVQEHAYIVDTPEGQRFEVSLKALADTFQELSDAFPEAQDRLASIRDHVQIRST